LEDFGYRITTVSNGEEAIQALESSTFDLILMDINMPGMSGFEAAKIIRKMESMKGQHTPIIALSGMVMSNSYEKFSDSGMDTFIPKPLDTNMLYRVIESYLEAQNSSSPGKKSH